MAADSAGARREGSLALGASSAFGATNGLLTRRSRARSPWQPGALGLSLVTLAGAAPLRSSAGGRATYTAADWPAWAYVIAGPGPASVWSQRLSTRPYVLFCGALDFGVRASWVTR